MNDLPCTLPIQEYRFDFVTTSPLTIRRDNGSAWRGLFGVALKQVVCVMSDPQCSACMVRYSCGYAYLFDTPVPPAAKKMRRYPAAPHPYAIVPPTLERDSELPANAPFSLNLRLFGEGRRYLAYLVAAWKRAGTLGLGRQQGRFRLRQVVQRKTLGGEQWTTIQQSEARLLQTLTTTLPPLPPLPQQVRLQLLSPLRVMRQGHLVTPEQFHFADLFHPLLRRLSMLCYFHTRTPLEVDFRQLNDLALQVPLYASALEWHPWVRYSNTQKQRIAMDGLTGSLLLEGEALGELWPYLWVGQWLGVGKGTVMGLGQYRITPLEAAGSSADAGEGEKIEK